MIRTFSMLGADGAGERPRSSRRCSASPTRSAPSPEGSTSRLDAEPEEKKRNFTLSLHPESFEEGGRSFHVLDCPGFAAFLTEVEWALQVTDGAYLAVSAADGAHNRAERTYDVLADSGRPAVCVITRLDHEQADFTKALADVEASLKVKPVPLQLPIGGGAAGRSRGWWTSSMKAHLVDGKAFGEVVGGDVPAELKDEAGAGADGPGRGGRGVGRRAARQVPRGRRAHAGGRSTAASPPAPRRKFLPVTYACAKSGGGVRGLLDLAVQVCPARGARGEGQGPRRQGVAPQRRRPHRAVRRPGLQDHHRPLRRPHRLRARLLGHPQAPTPPS